MTHIPEQLKQLVFDRAKGHCEYCLIHCRFRPNQYEIDHIVAEQHGGETISENLCLSCFKCNRYKGSNLASVDPDTKEFEYLFNPRQDKWDEHFRLVGARIEGLTPRGHATAFLLRFNDPKFLEERAELIAAGLYSDFEE